MEKWAYDIIDDNAPEVIDEIYAMLQRGLSPDDIADKYTNKGVCLDTLVQLAATYMLQEHHQYQSR